MGSVVLSDKLSFTPIDNQRLAELCGQFDEHLRLIEKKLKVQIIPHGHHFQIIGHQSAVNKTSQLLNKLYELTQHTGHVTPAKIHLLLQEAANHRQGELRVSPEFKLYNKYGEISPRSQNQLAYMKAIKHHDINFAIGPAGTGKTFLAVALAINALDNEQIQRIILARPAVEAGESLGYLPGDLSQKVDPYLRPLYDALYEMLGFEKVSKLLSKNIIEIAPLAYMRGRTLNDAFIILDEGQNTTREQMKMFLTRVGFGSITVITGDITQIDLPRGVGSGLSHAMKVLQHIPSISFTHFEARDAVRHPIVQQVILAYEKHESEEK